MAVVGNPVVVTGVHVDPFVVFRRIELVSASTAPYPVFSPTKDRPTHFPPAFALDQAAWAMTGARVVARKTRAEDVRRSMTRP